MIAFNHAVHLKEKIWGYSERYLQQQELNPIPKKKCLQFPLLQVTRHRIS